MALNDKQRAELEALRRENVRMKLLEVGVGRHAAVDGFQTGTLLRGDVEEWLAEQDAREATDRRSTLRWAKIAGWAGIVSVAATVIIGIASIFVTVWLAIK